MFKVDKVTISYERMPGGLTYLIIGAPKTGKSTQAAKWSEKGQDGVLVIDSDLGTDFIEGANRVTVTSLNPPERELFDENNVPIMAEDGTIKTEVIPPDERGYFYRSGDLVGKPMPVYSLSEVVFGLMAEWQELGYDTIVIDTVDTVNGWIEDEVAPEGIENTPFGAGYNKSTRRNMNIVEKLQMFVKKNAATLVLISHSKKSVEVDGKIQLMPELPKGLAGKLCAKADIIGFTSIEKATNKHKISFAGYDERSVGSRVPALQGKEFDFDFQAIKKAILGTKQKEKTK